jgi:hypothetical protein
LYTPSGRSIPPRNGRLFWQVVEFTNYLEPTTELIRPGSRVRVLPFPPEILGACEAPCARTMATAGDSREAKSHTFSEAAIRLPMSAAEYCIVT